MALAHRGYAVANDTRLRILLGVFEATLQRRPPTLQELTERTGVSNGSISHHAPLLEKDGLLETSTGKRGLIVTPAGVLKLSRSGLIEKVAVEPVYALTPKGLKLLEIAAQARDAAPDEPES